MICPSSEVSRANLLFRALAKRRVSRPALASYPGPNKRQGKRTHTDHEGSTVKVHGFSIPPALPAPAV